MAPYLDSDLTTTNDFETHVSSKHYEPDKNSNDNEGGIPLAPSKPALLQASPYTTPEHQLDLASLTTPLQIFAKSLLHMRALRGDYATAPYFEAFNWLEIVDTYSDFASKDPSLLSLEPLHFFVIVFRSRINFDADRELLGQLDSAAHIEAVEGGGLLKYWFGTPDADGRNLATCIWRDREDARLGGGGPGHIAAMMAARRMYNEWFVERLRLRVDPKTRAWTFVEWDDAPDGHG